MLEEIMNDLRD